MGLTPEAEEAQERSMLKEQEERARQAKQRKNNEQLVEMLAKKFQTPPPHQCDDPRVPAMGGSKFSLMRVNEDHRLIGRKRYIAPQKPKEFTAPQNLDTYPGGILEYIVQCGRKNGFPRNRIAFKLMEVVPSDDWETQEELCERILYELVNKHHQPLPDPDELESYYKINNIILNKRSSWITLPSGTWSLALYHQVSFKERVGDEIEMNWYKAMELKLEKEPA